MARGCYNCTNTAVKGTSYCVQCLAKDAAETARYYNMQSWDEVDPECDCITCQGYPDHPIRP